MRTSSLLLVVAIAGSALACRSDPTDVRLEILPLYVRSTVPADSAVAVGLDAPIDLSVTFRDEAAPDEVSMWLVPAPLSAGEVRRGPTGRVWTWHDLELSPDPFGYTLVVDGPRIPVPFTAHFFPRGWEHLHGRMGGCVTMPRERHDLRGTLVLAIPIGPPATGWDDLPSMSRQPPASVVRVTRLGNLCDAYYWLQFLDPETRYVIFAILDTSQDGAHDITEDWWAVYGGSSAVAVQPAVFFAPTSLDLELRPPHPGAQPVSFGTDPDGPALPGTIRASLTSF